MQIRLRTEDTRTCYSHPTQLTVDAHRTMGWDLQSGVVLDYTLGSKPRPIKEEVMEDETQPLASEDDSGGEAQPQLVQPEPVDEPIEPSVSSDELESPLVEQEATQAPDMVGHSGGRLDQQGSTTEDSEVQLIEVNLI